MKCCCLSLPLRNGCLFEGVAYTDRESGTKPAQTVADLSGGVVSIAKIQRTCNLFCKRDNSTIGGVLPGCPARSRRCKVRGTASNSGPESRVKALGQARREMFKRWMVAVPEPARPAPEDGLLAHDFCVRFASSRRLCAPIGLRGVRGMR
jgi:hypothetical protein